MAVLLRLLVLPLPEEEGEEPNLPALMVAQAEEVEWQYLTPNIPEVLAPQVREITAVQDGVLELTQTCRPEAGAEARVL
jgi:hypothetical protein